MSNQFISYYYPYINNINTNVKNLQSYILTHQLQNAKKMCNKFNNINLYRSYGWYHKDHPNNKHIIQKTKKIRCYQCYSNCTNNETANANANANPDLEKLLPISFTRIISYNTHANTIYDTMQKNENVENNKNTIISNITHIVCVCLSCYNENISLNKLPKYAPKSYSDILSDYILNEKFDLILYDIENIYNTTRFSLMKTKINYLQLCVNEKQNIINNLISQNTKLTQNINTEIDKYKILNQHSITNIELYNKLKNQLLQASIDMFKINKKQIDDHINKYNELNNTVKFTSSECKICLLNEIKIALQCGHTLCAKCYDQLIITQNDTIQNDTMQNDMGIINNIIQCPTCRTPSKTYIQLFL